MPTSTVTQRKTRVIPPLYQSSSGASQIPQTTGAPLIAKVPLLRWSRRDEHDPNADSARTVPPPGSANLNQSRELPDAQVWSRNMSRVLFDVLAGRRDVTTVRRWVEPHLYRRLQIRAEASPAHTPQSIPARVLSSRVCYPSKTVAEASIVVQEQGRSRAVAMRLESFRGRWKITALEIG